jgi:hypothetical protein
VTGLKMLGVLILVTALIGAAVLAYAVGAWVLGLVVGLGVWCYCLYVAFSRSTLRTIVRVDKAGQNTTFQVSAWRYPYWRNWALIGVVLIPLLAMAVPLVALVRSGDLMLTANTQLTPLPATMVMVPSPTYTNVPRDMRTKPAAVTQTPTALPATDTPEPTPTVPAPSETRPASTPTPSPTAQHPTSAMRATTAVSTSTSSPTMVPPTLTPTASPTWTPPAFPTETPFPIVTNPVPISPLPGREYKNPVTFSWNGTLYAGQSYRVLVRHVVSGDVVESVALTSQDWTIDLPAIRFGEWRWDVAVVDATGIVVSSPEQSFWFNPLPGTRRPSPTPSSTPRRNAAP